MQRIKIEPVYVVRQQSQIYSRNWASFFVDLSVVCSNNSQLNKSHGCLTITAL